jgi:FtsZ-binding cell division protein ZapB
MIMTDEQRYSAVIKELGEVLQHKNTTISCQKWQIDQLKEKLAAAEEERDFAKEKLADASKAIDILQAEVEELKGGAV